VSETLLLLHVLAAFALVAGTVMFSAVALGVPPTSVSTQLASVLWGIGAMGTLIFGIWLALEADQYEITDGWIIAAIVLWLAAGGIGDRAQRGFRAPRGERGDPGGGLDVGAHWVSTALVLALLVDMIWKFGA
jgi:hypothetical protein